MAIMIVEDDDLIVTQMEFIGEDLGAEIVHAPDGMKALSILETRQDIDIIISAWVLKTLDGVELVRRVRKIYSDDYIYFILQTGMGDTDSLVEGIEAGADDFIRKPIIEEEVKARINAGLRIRELQAVLRSNNRKLDDALQSIDDDLSSAARLIKSLLPDHHVDDFLEVRSQFEPCAHIGGDLYGYRKLSDRYFAFYQIDVSGHGVPSALMSFSLNNDLTFEAQSGDILIEKNSDGNIVPRKPSDVLADLNTRYMTLSESTMYFTMVYGYIDIHERKVSLAQGGHPSPLVLRHDSGECLAIGDGGFTVGMFDFATYEDIELTLSSGDILFLYSDALIEALNEEDKIFDTERVIETVKGLHKQPLETIIEEMRKPALAWSNAQRFDDDQTILGIKMQ